MIDVGYTENEKELLQYLEAGYGLSVFGDHPDSSRRAREEWLKRELANNTTDTDKNSEEYQRYILKKQEKITDKWLDVELKNASEWAKRENININHTSAWAKRHNPDMREHTVAGNFKNMFKIIFYIVLLSLAVLAAPILIDLILGYILIRLLASCISKLTDN